MAIKVTTFAISSSKRLPPKMCKITVHQINKRKALLIVDNLFWLAQSETSAGHKFEDQKNNKYEKSKKIYERLT